MNFAAVAVVAVEAEAVEAAGQGKLRQQPLAGPHWVASASVELPRE